MGFVDDDAQKRYDLSVEEDRELENNLFEMMMAEEELSEIDQRIQSTAPAPSPTAPATPSPDAGGDVQPADPSSLPINPDADPGDEHGVPISNVGESDQLPVIPEPASPSAEGTYSFGSIMRAGRTGIFQKGATVIDNGLMATAEMLEAMGWEGVDDFETNELGQKIGIFRPLVDRNTPRPDTTIEEVAEEIGPILVVLTPIMLAATAALAGVGIPLLTAGALSGVSTGGLWGGLTYSATDANIVTQAREHGVNLGPGNVLGVNPEDSTAKRMLKNATVDGAIGVMGELAIVVGRYGIKAAAIGLKKAKVRQGIKSVVTATGRQGDEALEATTDALQGAQAKKELLEQNVEATHEAVKLIDDLDSQAAEILAFGSDAEVQTLTRSQRVLLDEGTAKLDDALRQANIEFDEAQKAVVRAVEQSPGEKLYLEKMRQAIGDKDTTSNLNRAFGKATESADQYRKPGTVFLTEEVEIGADDMLLISRLLQEGNVDDVARVFSNMWDSRNYNRIAAAGDEGEGIRMVIASVSKILRRDGQGFTGVGVIPQAQTKEEAVHMVGRILAEAGGDPAEALNFLKRINPDIDAARVTVNAMRILEASIAEAHLTNVAKVGTDAWDTSTQFAMIQHVKILAEVENELVGSLAGFGRALNSAKIIAEPIDFDDVVGVAAGSARALEMEAAIKAFGGGDKVDLIASTIKAANDPTAVKGILEASLDDTTLGDYFFNVFISSALSGPWAQVRNMSTNFMMLAGNIGPMVVLDNIAMTVRHGNMQAWKHWTDLIQGSFMSGKAALGVGKGGFNPANSSVRRSFHSGRRETAGESVKFADELHARGRLTSPAATASLIRRGIPVTIPATRALQKTSLAQRAGMQPHHTTFPLLGPEGTRLRRGANKLADVIEIRKGVAAKTYDWMGRTTNIGVGLLASGDELTAAASYGGSIFVAARHAVEGANLEKYADVHEAYEALLRDAPKWKKFRQAAGAGDEDAIRYADDLKRINDDASAMARGNTFTDMPDEALAKFLEFRDMIPAMRWMQAFVRTPYNVAKVAVLDLNPVAQGVKAGLSAVKDGPGSDAFAKRTARFAATSAVYYSGYLGVQSGRIQGGGPRNFEQNELWKSSVGPDGLLNVPYSIRAYGRRYSFELLDPIFTSLGIMSDLMIVHDKADNDTYLSISAQFLDVLTDAMGRVSGMKAMGLMMDLIDNPENAIRQNIVNIVGTTIVPGASFQRQVGRIFNDDKTQIPNQEPGVGGVLGEIVARGEADTLPPFSQGFAEVRKALDAILGGDEFTSSPSLNYWGDIRQHNPGVVHEFENPYSDRIAQTEFSAVTEEMKRLSMGISVNKEFGIINGVQLSPQQQHFYQRQFADPDNNGPGPTERRNRQTIHTLLFNKMFDKDGKFTERWKNLGDSVGGKETGNKVSKLNDVITKRKRDARKELYKKYPSLEDTVDRHAENNPSGKDPKRKRDSDKIKRRLELGEDTTTSATFERTKVEDLLN